MGLWVRYTHVWGVSCRSVNDNRLVSLDNSWLVKLTDLRTLYDNVFKLMSQHYRMVNWDVNVQWTGTWVETTLLELKRGLLAPTQSSRGCKNPKQWMVINQNDDGEWLSAAWKTTICWHWRRVRLLALCLYEHCKAIMFKPILASNTFTPKLICKGIWTITPTSRLNTVLWMIFRLRFSNCMCPIFNPIILLFVLLDCLCL